jgi:hypothetical protein
MSRRSARLPLNPDQQPQLRFEPDALLAGERHAVARVGPARRIINSVSFDQIPNGNSG